MNKRHRKIECESTEETNNSFSICGQEMVLYPRKVLYEVMLRKRNQRVSKVCHYHYKATAMRRRIAADVSHDVTRRAIRTVGRSSRRPVHREQSLEEVSSSPRPHFSVQVRSLLYQQHTSTMSTAAATAITHATRESIQNTNTPARLHVPGMGDNKKNNLLFSAQCSDNDSTDVLLEQSSHNQQQTPTTTQQCYLNSTYDYLFQRHVDTLNKVISESAGQNQIIDKNIKKEQKNKQQSSDQKVDLLNQQQIRISVSISEESGTSQDVSSLASEERRSPPAASDCSLENSASCKDIENSLETLNIDPDKPRIVLSEQQNSTDSAKLLNSTAARRSRSPSPLLEVPVESVDISREIRRPPIQ